MSNNKHPLIVFSGGLDSTFLLFRNLLEGPVYTLYVKSSQGERKIEKELKARERIIKHLEKVTGNKVLQDYIVDLSVKVSWRTNNYANDEGLGFHKSHWRFKQPFLWFHGMFSVVNSEIHSKVLMGYVTGDQISSQLHRLHEAWVSLSIVTFSEVVPLDFPLMFVRKTDMLRDLDEKIVKLTWTCEEPTEKGRACQRCAACHTLMAAKFVREKEISANSKIKLSR